MIEKEGCILEVDLDRKERQQQDYSNIKAFWKVKDKRRSSRDTEYLSILNRPFN